MSDTNLDLEDKDTSDAPSLEAEGTTEQRAADDKGEPGAVPYHRFKEVNDAAKSYAKLGKPEDVEARLARLDQIEREQAAATEATRQREAAEARQANPKQAEVDDLIADSIRRQYPGLADAAERQKETERLSVARHVQHGWEMIPALLKEHGLPTDKETVASYENLVESQLIADNKLKAGFWEPSQQADVMREGFARAKSRVINPALQAAGAKTLDDARARASRTIGRAAQTGTTRVEPKKFASKHQPGTAGHEADRSAYRRQQIADLLDADSGEESAAL